MPAHKMIPAGDENGMSVYECEYCKRKIGLNPHGSGRYPEAPAEGEPLNADMVAKTLGNEKCDA